MTSATYAGTTGHSGTDTSRAQADDLPKHGRAQAWVLRSAANLGAQGVTIVDLRSWFSEMHHGTLSSALTNLHRDGRLARLVDKRDRCHIYVLPEHVGDRPTEPPTARPGGFDAAQAALNEQARREGYDLGWADGEQRGRAAAATAVIQHIDAMRSAMGPGSAGTHDDRCWQRHVRCALTAVRSTAVRARGEGPA